MLDELGDAALVIKLVRLLRLFTLVLDRDANAFVEKRLFAQPLGQLVETEIGVSKIVESGLKVILVPRFRVLPVCRKATTGMPRTYSCS